MKKYKLEVIISSTDAEVLETKKDERFYHKWIINCLKGLFAFKYEDYKFEVVKND